MALLIRKENELKAFEQINHFPYLKDEWKILNAQRQTIAEILQMFPIDAVKKVKQ